jgi:hypothetical protein
VAAESLLNDALDEDTLDDSYVSKAASRIVYSTELSIDSLYLDLRRIRRCLQGAFRPTRNYLSR